jgi:alkanesulfonate monooxygenase SsuD/methylene tetrahydromethanopterin reductase-like flavin-dependent oxidoreductase (luciferase family)
MTLAFLTRSLDALADGRFELGIGAGGRPSDESMRGLDPMGAWERSVRLHDTVFLVDRLLRGETVEQETGRASLAGDNVVQPRPPFVVAAHGPNTVEVAARYGDRWNVAGLRRATRAEQLARIAQLGALLDEGLARNGRARGDVARSALVGINPGLTYSSLDELLALAGELATLGFSEIVIYDPPFALDDGPAAPASIIEDALANLDRFAAL